MNTTMTVDRLKDAAQDYEWYPTTKEMIAVIAYHVKSNDYKSIIDIGAGDGRVLKGINAEIDRTITALAAKHGNAYGLNTFANLYSIEKSEILRSKQDADIITLGTDFNTQTLIDKQVDVVFCNPPYSEYEQWSERIIREANAMRVYLIIPQRWKASGLITAAIKQREARATVIWSGNFLEADRKARAVVDIVEINLRDSGWESERQKTDPFGLWFDSFFPEFDKSEGVEESETESERLHNIVAGKSRVEHLCECYRQDMNKLCDNYRAVAKLDKDILKEIGTDKNNLKTGLKEKISRLKSLYWHELINRLDAVTNRLTSTTRKQLIEKINNNLSVDFTEENAFAVVLWMVKNANGYVNEQLITVFKEFTAPENIINYKSNQRTWEKDRWRFNDQKASHYALDYRVIIERSAAIRIDKYFGYNYEKNLSSQCHAIINDVVTVGKNLGFSVIGSSFDHEWESGKKIEFNLSGGGLFMDVKAFKNGNVHFRFNQDFIKTLNIEAARLLGWIKTPAQAAEEMNVDFDFAAKRFGSNIQLGNNQLKALCG